MSEEDVVSICSKHYNQNDIIKYGSADKCFENYMERLRALFEADKITNPKKLLFATTIYHIKGEPL